MLYTGIFASFCGIFCVPVLTRGCCFQSGLTGLVDYDSDEEEEEMEEDVPASKRQRLST